MACSGAGQGAAGAKRGRKPKVVDDPMEDALLIEHFCDSALSGGSNSSGSSAGIISTGMLNLQLQSPLHILCWQHRALFNIVYFFSLPSCDSVQSGQSAAAWWLL